MARDNFSKKIIDKLRMRVANRCSNPECRVPTTGPSGALDKVNNIGVAAHICAAAPGGPRYSQEMTPNERKSIKNAIWLCANCSVDIDRDEEKYTISLLKEWKNQAEQNAREELGRKLPHKNDAINTVSAALTGLPISFLPTAIDNVHKASEKSLELLDPRFVIKSGYTKDGPSYTLHAKEEVNVTMAIKGKHAKDYENKYKRLVEHGDDFEVHDVRISFNGSELMKEISKVSPTASLTIKQNKKKGIQKVWIVDSKTSAIEVFEDIHGKIRIGRNSFTFEGSACGDIFTFKYQKLFNKVKSIITFGLDFKKWEGIDLRFLPYFSKCFSFFEKLANGWEFFSALEVDGIRELESEGKVLSELDFVKSIRTDLTYIDKAKIVSTYLGEQIVFTSNFSYSLEEFSRLSYAANVIRGLCVYSEKDIVRNATSSIVVDQGAKIIQFLKNVTEPGNFKILQHDNETIKCFGKPLKLPPKEIRLKRVTPKLAQINKGYKVGDIVNIEWIPSTGFQYIEEYVSS